MPKIFFVEFNGTEHEVDAVAGRSIMKAAVLNGVPGIDAVCNGCCTCSTCHCYIDREWIDKVPTPHEGELAILNSVPHRQPNSRLSCQISVTDELDGVVVRLPENQLL